MKLFNLLKTSSEKYPDRPAIIENNISITYADLIKSCEKLADVLRCVQSNYKSIAAIVLDNCPEYIISLYGISAAGAIVLPLSTKYKPAEFIPMLKQGDVSIVITNKKFIAANPDLVKLNITIIGLEYCQEQKLNIEIVKQAASVKHSVPTDTAMLVPTSGSTGKPKLVMLTNHGLVNNMQSYISTLSVEGRHIAGVTLPMDHIYCMCAQLLTHISRADAIAILPTLFFASRFAENIKKYNISVVAMVPHLADRLVELEPFPGDQLKTLKYLTLSAARTLPETYQRLKILLPDTCIINMYGMTEAGSRIAMADPYDDKYPVQSVGKPISCIAIRITDNGRIEIKGQGVTQGYYKDAELTRKNISAGWFNTGDLGCLDENGYLYIKGRSKNTIISGGLNIDPMEIESILQKHPLVKHAIVVAKKDKRLGQIPVAFIAVDNAKNITNSQLITHCRKFLSDYKIPANFILVKNIPTLGSLKSDRRKLELEAQLI